MKELTKSKQNELIRLRRLHKDACLNTDYYYELYEKQVNESSWVFYQRAKNQERLLLDQLELRCHRFRMWGYTVPETKYTDNRAAMETR